MEQLVVVIKRVPLKILAGTRVSFKKNFTALIISFIIDYTWTDVNVYYSKAVATLLTELKF